MRRSRSLSALAALLLALAACGGPPEDVATSASSASAAARGEGGEGLGRPVEVLSRNLYLGAELDPVVAATSFPAFLEATTEVWNTVVANDFHSRAVALAKEIATIQPDLVGLQEAFLWRVQDPGDFLVGGTVPATDVAFDYVADLLAALEERGQHYTVAVSIELLDFEAPTLLGIDVRATDRQVILAREGVEISNPRAQVFSVLLPLVIMGTPVVVERGWTAVDAEVRGEQFAFFNTHLESFFAPVRVAQGMELAQVVGATPGPLVLVGDLNSLPGTEAAAILTAPPPAGPGLVDVWEVLHPNQPGFTCCFPELLSDPSQTLDERIDYVMVRDARPLTAKIVGDVLGERRFGLWPSDHAGVTAGLRIGGGD